MVSSLPHRRNLLAVAYRLLGSYADAEDVVQEAHLRWASRDDAEPIVSPRAWLERVVVNLCLDHLKSARVRREAYVGPWLPEPIPTDDTGADRESVSLALLTVLERLSPLERAAYVLAEAFDYGAEEVAAVLDREPAAVRQLLHRARAHVADARPRFAPSREAHAAILAAFFGAIQSGDVKQVESFLSESARACTDGGGKVRAALNEVRGRTNVARLLVGIAAKATAAMEYAVEEINGWPALVVRERGVVTSVATITTDGREIAEVLAVSNPDKLGAFRTDVTAATATSSSEA